MKTITMMALGALVAHSLVAQNWPLPAATPNTPVVCSASCPPAFVGKPTPGWSGPVVAFTGRFVDSAYTQDWQQTFRTARAGLMRTSPDGKRIYFALGAAVAAYDADRFFTRLDAHEPLISAAAVPVNPPNVGTHPGAYENFLNFDQFFYAENTASGWITPLADGQDRLFDFDVDDRGIVYLAYSVFGWGMAKDSGATTNGLMSPSYQDTTSLGFAPRRIFWLKSSSGSYYAFVGTRPTLVFNVEDWQHPVARGSFQEGYVDYARGNRRVAVITDAGEFRVYDTDTFIAGGGPILRQTAVPAGSIGTYLFVVFDGMNFWAAAESGSTYAGVLTKYAPDGSGSYTRTDYQLSDPTVPLVPVSMRYRDGYIGIGASVSNGYDQRLYNVVSGTPAEIPLNGVFFHYYSAPPTGYIRAPRAQANMLHPWMRNGHFYAVVPASGLGDAWQLSTGSTSTCATLVPGSNAVASFQGPTSGCSNATGICLSTESIAFKVTFAGSYDAGCSPHTYTWLFDDGSQSSGVQVSKSLTTGSHVVSCRISNGLQAVNVDTTVTVGPHGDANGDGRVTAADIFYLIHNLLAGGPAPAGVTDVNGDGVVNAADLFYLINYLFAGGAAPK